MPRATDYYNDPDYLGIEETFEEENVVLPGGWEKEGRNSEHPDQNWFSHPIPELGVELVVTEELGEYGPGAWWQIIDLNTGEVLKESDGYLPSVYEAIAQVEGIEPTKNFKNVQKDFPNIKPSKSIKKLSVGSIYLLSEFMKRNFTYLMKQLYSPNQINDLKQEIAAGSTVGLSALLAKASEQFADLYPEEARGEPLEEIFAEMIRTYPQDYIDMLKSKIHPNYPRWRTKKPVGVHKKMFRTYTSLRLYKRPMKSLTWEQITPETTMATMGEYSIYATDESIRDPNWQEDMPYGSCWWRIEGPNGTIEGTTTHRTIEAAQAAGAAALHTLIREMTGLNLQWEKHSPEWPSEKPTYTAWFDWFGDSYQVTVFYDTSNNGGDFWNVDIGYKYDKPFESQPQLPFSFDTRGMYSAKEVMQAFEEILPQMIERAVKAKSQTRKFSDPYPDFPGWQKEYSGNYPVYSKPGWEVSFEPYVQYVGSNLWKAYDVQYHDYAFYKELDAAIRACDNGNVHSEPGEFTKSRKMNRANYTSRTRPTASRYKTIQTFGPETEILSQALSPDIEEMYNLLLLYVARGWDAPMAFDYAVREINAEHPEARITGDFYEQLKEDWMPIINELIEHRDEIYLGNANKFRQKNPLLLI